MKRSISTGDGTGTVNATEIAAARTAGAIATAEGMVVTAGAMEDASNPRR